MRAKKVVGNQENYNVRHRIKWYKNKKTLVYIIGFFIIFIMIGSVLVSWEGSEETKKEYNGVKFIKNEEGGWITSINGKNVLFGYLPEELENISSEKFYLNNGKVYVAFDHGSYSEGSFEIQRLMGLLYLLGYNVVPACYSEENCPDVPIVNCDKDVIKFIDSEDTKIYNKENCIVIESESGEQIKVIDRFIFGLMGVI